MCGLTDEMSNSPTQIVATFKTDYSGLYDVLCSTLKEDQTTLLLYLLMHRNVTIKAFVMSRTNMDQLVSDPSWPLVADAPLSLSD